MGLSGTNLMIAVNLGLICSQMLMGGYHVLGHNAFKYMPPVVFCFYREIMAGPSLLIIAALVERVMPNFKEDWWRFLLLGLTGIYGNQLLFNLGLNFTSATQAAIMQPCIPVFTAAIALSIGVEKFSIIKVIGILFAVGGAVTMAGFKDISLHDNRSIGMLCLLGNTLVMSIYLIFQKTVLKKYPPISVTGFAYVIGSFFMGLTSLYYVHHPEVYKIEKAVYFPLAYSVIFATVIAYMLVTWGNKHAPSSIVAVYNCLQPLTSAFLSYIFMGEEIVLREGVGAGLIGIGLAFVVFARYRESKQEKEEEKISPNPIPDSHGSVQYRNFYVRTEQEGEKERLLNGTINGEKRKKRASM